MRKYTNLPYIEYPVASNNYGESGRLPVTQIIIHSTVGSYMGAINYFNNPSAGTSAHYVISNKGELAAMLEEYYVAYHCGNLSVNQRSVGIEHEWYQGMAISDALYKKSAQLVADICREYGLSCNRGVVKGHNEIVATRCPNQINVDRIVKEANAILNPQPTPPTETIESLKKQIADLKATEKRLIQEKDAVVQEKDRIVRELTAKHISELANLRDKCLTEFREKGIAKLKEIN